MAKLIGQRYGKARVRVLKILRDGRDPHDQGDRCHCLAVMAISRTSYTAGDNTKVVPTDTIKNTINVLAKATSWRGNRTVRGASLGRTFSDALPAGASRRRSKLPSDRWNRLTINGKPHPHSFRAGE